MLGVRPKKVMGVTVSPALRLSAAVLFSSIAAVPIYLIAILLASNWGDRSTLFPVLMVALILTMGGVVFIGLPIHFVLARVNLRSVWVYGAAGFVVPLIFVLLAQPFGGDAALGLLGQVLLGGFFGSCVALVFWKVALCP